MAFGESRSLLVLFVTLFITVTVLFAIFVSDFFRTVVFFSSSSSDPSSSSFSFFNFASFLSLALLFLNQT